MGAVCLHTSLSICGRGGGGGGGGGEEGGEEGGSRKKPSTKPKKPFQQFSFISCSGMWLASDDSVI